MDRVDGDADRRACRQVADQLRELIDGGFYPAGELIPSPRVLARECGVHVDTARRAVSILAHEGRVRPVPGVGTVVLGDQPVRTVEVAGPARISVRMPSQPERQELDIPAGVPLLLLERFTEGEVVAEQLLADRTVLEIPGPG